MKQTKQKTGKTRFLALLGVLVVVCGLMLTACAVPDSGEVAQVTDGYPEDYQAHFSQVWSKNKDFKGYLTLEGTALATTVVQSSDNVTYRECDFDGNLGRTAFLDYRADVKTPSGQLLVYLPDATDHEMYKELVNFKNLEYYKEHPLITFNSVYENAKYKVFAVALFPSGSDEIPYQTCMESTDEAQMATLIQSAKDHSILEIPVDVQPDDELLTVMSEDLSLRDENGKYARILVFARKVRDNESVQVETSKAVVKPNTYLPDNWYTQILRSQYVSTVNQQIRQEAAAWFTAYELSQIPDDDLELQLTARKAEFAKYLNEQELKLPVEEKIYLYEKRKQEAENPALKLDIENLTARVGDKVKLTAKRTPEDPTASYSWHSSDEKVVAVSGKGSSADLTFKKEGTATITVTSGTASATCKVEVKAAEAFVLNPSAKTITEGKLFTITASSEIAKAASSDTKVAKVTYKNNVATVTAAAPGQATITLTNKNGTSATCKVTVEKYQLALNKTSLTLEKGSRYNLAVTKGDAVNWYTDNSSVVRVKMLSNGNTAQLEAVGAGTTTITATARNGVQAKCKVTVTDNSIALSSKNMDLFKGETKGLRVTRGAASDWISSNQSIVRVYPIGDGSYAEVEAVGYGTATIQAKANNGTYASCTVTVSAPRETLTIVPYSMTMQTGDMRNITVTGGSAKNWVSSDPSIAEVYVIGNGSMAQVEAKGAGRTTIRVQDSLGSWLSCEVTVNAPTPKLEIGPANVHMEVGDWVDVSVISGKAVDWSSSDAGVVRVYGNDNTSKVSIKGEAAGTAKVVAYAADGSTAVCNVTVTNPTPAAEPLTLNKSSMQVTVGEWYDLRVSSGYAVNWDSSNAGIVGVYAVGGDTQKVQVKADSAGTARIIAYAADGSTAECTITAENPQVVEPVEPLAIGPSFQEMEVGDWNEVWVVSGDAVDWNTSNPNVVRVYGNDDTSIVKIKAESPGEAEIIAYAADGTVSKCKVRVNAMQMNGAGVFIEETQPAPVVTEPPATEPPVTEPPVTAPPVTEPPVTEPPATEPPVTQPPVTEPPVTEPPAPEPQVVEEPVYQEPAPVEEAYVEEALAE